jgi:hypothetical protein
VNAENKSLLLKMLIASKKKHILHADLNSRLLMTKRVYVRKRLTKLKFWMKDSKREIFERFMAILQ